MVLLAIALVGVIAGALIFRAAPRLAFAAWTGVLFFVPIWVGFSLGYFYSAITLVTLLCVMAASAHGFRFTKVDWILIAFGLLVTGSFAFGGVALGHLLIAVLDWLLPYLFGRVVLARVGIHFISACIAVAAVCAAALAIVEFVTGTNLFVLMRWDNIGYTLWSTLQPRGGFVRAEGAFGHSIALGASLSIASVFVLATRWKLGIRIACLAVLGVAVVLTFSRIGLVSLALGIVLSIAFLAGLLTTRARLTVAAISILGALVAVPFLNEVFSAAGTEASGSADYRLDLVSLVSLMAPLGRSPGYQVLPNGEVFVGSFQSIDSVLILLGLRFGYIPLILLLCLLVTAVVAMFRSRANPPLIAVIAQIPTFATVDLITQLPYLVWFCGGLAVSLYILDDERAGTPAMKKTWALVPEGGLDRHG